jgi:hypothetical protein
MLRHAVTLGVCSLLLAACDKEASRTESSLNESESSTIRTPSTATPSTAEPQRRHAETRDASCGTAPLEDCPLQAWMKANMGRAAVAQDLPALAQSLAYVAKLAPEGYANWESIARDGAAAAQMGDFVAARAACRSCHEQYKHRYRAELRGRSL